MQRVQLRTCDNRYVEFIHKVFNCYLIKYIAYLKYHSIIQCILLNRINTMDHLSWFQVRIICVLLQLSSRE